MKFYFGDIVLVDDFQIGVIVKSWCSTNGNNYDIYVRSYDAIKNYRECRVQRYMVRHKYLSDEEKQYQYNTINGC